MAGRSVWQWRCQDRDGLPRRQTAKTVFREYFVNLLELYGCSLGLPDFGKSFKIIVKPGFSHEFDHAEFNGAHKKACPKISRGRYFELKI